MQTAVATNDFLRRQDLTQNRCRSFNLEPRKKHEWMRDLVCCSAQVLVMDSAVFTHPVCHWKIAILGGRSFYFFEKLMNSNATKIRAIDHGSTLTNHSICFDSTKNARHHLVQDFPQLFPNQQVLVIERENPAAAAIVASAAKCVLGCQEVLRDQRRLPFVVLELVLDGWNHCFVGCNHQCSFSIPWYGRCDHRNPANIDLRLSVPIISVPSVENGFESVS